VSATETEKEGLGLGLTLFLLSIILNYELCKKSSEKRRE